jgi:hypothetical protein
MTAVTDTYDFLGEIAPQLKKGIPAIFASLLSGGRGTGEGGQWGHVPPTFFKSEKVHALFSGLNAPFTERKKYFLNERPLLLERKCPICSIKDSVKAISDVIKIKI